MREMKDSGIDWIGKIPENWSIMKLKKVCSIQTGNTPSKTMQNIYYSDDEGTLWIKAEDLGKYESINNTNEYLTEEGMKYGRIFKENTVFVCCIASVGKVGFSDKRCSCNQQINGLMFNQRMNWKYGFYMTIAQEEEYNVLASGNVVKIINSDRQGNIDCTVPPKKEQDKIVKFLDNKIIEIDNVIEKTKVTIEDYKNYKKNFIIKVTTKGLDKNAEMKDTDSGWIGKIPKHWDFVRINTLFHTVDERNEDENAMLLSLYTSIGIKPRSELEEKGNKAVTVLNYKKVKENDIIVNKLLAWMGAIAYSDYEGVTSPDYDVYRAKEKANVVRSYYNAYFRYTNFNGDCHRYGHGIMLMRWRTYPEELLRIKVPNPPYDEQVKIAKAIDDKCSEIDKLIENKEKMIEELEQYKKSLIYEYVTGKKEVV